MFYRVWEQVRRPREIASRPSRVGRVLAYTQTGRVLLLNERSISPQPLGTRASIHLSRRDHENYLP